MRLRDKVNKRQERYWKIKMRMREDWNMKKKIHRLLHRSTILLLVLHCYFALCLPQWICSRRFVRGTAAQWIILFHGRMNTSVTGVDPHPRSSPLKLWTSEKAIAIQREAHGGYQYTRNTRAPDEPPQTPERVGWVWVGTEREREREREKKGEREG